MGRFDKLTELSQAAPGASSPRILGSDSAPAPLASTPHAVPVPEPVPVPSTPLPPFRKRLIIRRYPVDPYEDQLTALDELSATEKDQGLRGSRTAMVRDALDMYFKLRPHFDAARQKGFRGTIIELFEDILANNR
ncbi:hypothetical protein ACGF07_26145 [Kitasatospora sp. NPDC048194]|uniref:hypothetical protein n=1 Tax=Kitasatospora sp. NPDC048194 TaxID=3364045 RepID=UPI00371642A5